MMALMMATMSQPPSLYWSSTPVIANDTLLMAGAGLSSIDAMRFCTSSANCSAAMGAGAGDVWEHSVKAVVPTCGPPCFLELISSASASMTVPINTPDVWWVNAMHPSRLNFSDLTPHDPLLLGHVVSLRSGETLRVFGRSLAWDAETQTTCISGKPEPNDGTTLSLTRQSRAQAQVEVVASTAACYEATFALPPLPAGKYTGMVRTVWGESQLLSLHISDEHAPSHPVLLDVQGDFHGNLTAALAAATVASSDGALVEVSLGPHTYSLATEVHVPPNTTLRGAGASSTSLSFSMPAAEGRAMHLGSGVALLNFTIELTDTKVAGVVGITAQGTQGLYAAGLTVIGRLPSAIAVDLDRVSGFELIGNRLVQQGACAPAVVRPALRIHGARFGLLAASSIDWRCMAFGIDVTDEVCLTHCLVPLPVPPPSRDPCLKSDSTPTLGSSFRW